jgi:mannose-6-phosphate isomerase-like protein (cupin superfamily)
MNNLRTGPLLRMHRNYERLVSLATECEKRGRDPFLANERDIALARLYSHAFRRHVIGAFHATRQEIGAVHFDRGQKNPTAAMQIARAMDVLTDLANRSMDPVGRDVRALVSTFNFYAGNIRHVVSALHEACRLTGHAGLQLICDRFVAHMEEITSCNGISLTRDTSAPLQGSFVVPNLGITIVPLVYGDQISWNLAWLDGQRSDVPCHLHREGIEIHLGYSPLHGYTILGNAKAEVTEGYAMPIPPGTRHGYTNIGNQTHHVPFIFGSPSLGGWGVFLDVEPTPSDAQDMADSVVVAQELNGTVFLEREIERAASEAVTHRRAIIPAARTDRNGAGGIELSLARVANDPLVLESSSFRAVSVVRGQGRILLAGEEVEIGPRDHFGIPAGLKATVECSTASGGEPLVFLDAILESNPPSA